MKKIISTNNAPAAIGPYSQAVDLGNWVFCSGQIPLDPATGQFDASMPVKDQVNRVMQNVKAVLEAAGCTFEHVVKSTIFVTDLGDFATVNEVYGAHFPSNPPARSTVQVAALPRGAKVEIEVVAYRA